MYHIQETLREFAEQDEVAKVIKIDPKAHFCNVTADYIDELESSIAELKKQFLLNTGRIKKLETALRQYTCDCSSTGKCFSDKADDCGWTAQKALKGKD